MKKIAFAQLMIALSSVLVLLALPLEPSQASTGQAISSPSDFKDDFDSELASDNHDLWFVVTGADQKDVLRSQLFRYDGGRWDAAPGRPRTTTDTAIELALSTKGPGPATPCVGDTSPKGNPRVRCLGKRGWMTKSFPGSLRGHFLGSLVSMRGETYAMVSRWEVDRTPSFHYNTTVQVFRLQGPRFLAHGPVMRINRQAVPRLAQSTTVTRNRAIRVGVMTTTNPASRWVSTLEGNRWVRSRDLPGDLVGGGMLSGPVQSGNSTFFPVTQIEFPERSDYLQSTYRLAGKGTWSEVGGAPVNTGAGDAQGGIFAVGSRVWTQWSELDFQNAKFGGLIRTHQFAARLNRSGTAYDKTIELWDGKTLFPDAGQVVEYRNRPVFSYTRQFSKKGGMRATVDFSHR